MQDRELHTTVDPMHIGRVKPNEAFQTASSLASLTSDVQRIQFDSLSPDPIIREKRQVAHPINTTPSPPIQSASRKQRLKSKMKHWIGSRSPSSIKRPKAFLVGLLNLGNTCFLASVVQSLIAFPHFTDYLLIQLPLSAPRLTLLPLVIELIVSMTEAKPYSHCTPSSLCKAISSQFRTDQQHDAHELLVYLLDSLHQEIGGLSGSRSPSTLTRLIHSNAKLSPSNSMPFQPQANHAFAMYRSTCDSPLIDLFCGQIQSSLQCLCCKRLSSTFDIFWDLSLPMPVTSITMNAMESFSLEYCLHKFIEIEILCDTIQCQYCNTHSHFQKRYLLYRTPPILIFHLKRFMVETQTSEKLNTSIAIPLSIDLGPFHVDPSLAQGTHYTCKAIICHEGSLHTGHYIAYCKYQDQWYEYDDQDVTNVPETQIEQLKSAYILFYERNPVKTASPRPFHNNPLFQ